MLYRNKQLNLLFSLVFLLLGSEALAFSGVAHVLPSGKWHQITLPCTPPAAKQTVAGIFGDDLAGEYGTDWIMFGFDGASGSSESIQINTVLQQNKSYWIMQQSGTDKILDMPEGCQIPSLNTSSACASPDGCFEIPLAAAGNQKVWNMAGYPFDVANGADKVRVVTDASTSVDGCPTGCDLATAKARKLVHNRFAHFSGMEYEPIGDGSTFQPWQGFWIASLPGSYGLNPRLLIPAPEPPVPVGRALLGPLDNAVFSLKRVSDGQTIYNGVTSQGNGSDIATSGLIAVPDIITDQLENGLYQLTISGGNDVDANDDKVWDAMPTANTGSIHGILSAQQIKNRDFTVNILTELVYQDIKDKVAAVPAGVVSEDDISLKIENNVDYLLNLA
ncbi:hypothetical protein Thini_1558 [Thiothrix nivea DSM 5205]|uniref:Uncharacterized protein n=2 Tax=Thiothrix nivea TaxID=1031 RepID=A0A656HG45_THINJ|nr:hypothetical protein Thini_1558 [Thiothrix nivea DSM 5205]